MSIGPIEKNIPIQPKGAHRAGEFMKQLGALEVGDSFMVTGSKQTSVSGMLSRWARVWDRKFTTRRIKDGEFRIWRTA